MICIFHSPGTNRRYVMKLQRNTPGASTLQKFTAAPPYMLDTHPLTSELLERTHHRLWLVCLGATSSATALEFLNFTATPQAEPLHHRLEYTKVPHHFVFPFAFPFFSVCSFRNLAISFSTPISSRRFSSGR